MTTENNSNDNKEQTMGIEINGEDSFMAQNREPQVRNADNEWLGSWGGPGFCVGFVEEVNGLGAAEVVGFDPTRHELLELARYWTNVALEIEYSWFLYGQVGSSDMRRQPFAWRRVGRIKELLGADVDKIVDEVYEEFGKNENPRYWEAFLHGTAEQREAVQEEIQDEIARTFQERDGNQNDQQEDSLRKQQ